MTAQRHVWMDAVRGIAIILVILYHGDALMEERGMEPPRGLHLFNEAMSPYRMPLLVYLSGSLLQRSLSKPWKTFAVGKLRNIGWPYVVWSLLTLAATTGLTAQALIGIIVLPPTFLWFLWFLLAFYAIGWVCHQLQVNPLLVSVAALAASAFLPEFARASRFAFLLAFFMLGHAVASRRIDLRLSPTARVLVVLVCTGTVIVVSTVTTLGIADVRYDPMFAFGPLALVILVHLLSSWYVTSHWLVPVEYVGRNSMVFYVTHYPVQSLVIRAVERFEDPPSWVVYTAATGISLVVGFAFCRLREAWQPAGWLFAYPTGFAPTLSFARFRPSVRSPAPGRSGTRTGLPD